MLCESWTHSSAAWGDAGFVLDFVLSIIWIVHSFFNEKFFGELAFSACDYRISV